MPQTVLSFIKYTYPKGQGLPDGGRHLMHDTSKVLACLSFIGVLILTPVPLSGASTSSHQNTPGLAPISTGTIHSPPLTVSSQSTPAEFIRSVQPKDLQAPFVQTQPVKAQPMASSPPSGSPAFWGGTGYDSSVGSAVGPDGSVYVVGFTNSFTPNMATYDAFIVKYTSSGTMAWQETWGTSNDDVATAVVTSPVSSSPYLYVTGWSNMSGIISPFVLKLRTSTGALACSGCSITLTTGIYTVPTSIAISPDGSSVYIAGSMMTSRGDYDVFLVKFAASSLVPSWGRNWGNYNQAYGYAEDSASSVVVSPDNKYVYVAGATQLQDLSYGLILKYGVGGALLNSWQLNEYWTNGEEITAMAISPDGAYLYVVGCNCGGGGAGYEFPEHSVPVFYFFTLVPQGAFLAKVPTSGSSSSWRKNWYGGQNIEIDLPSSVTTNGTAIYVSGITTAANPSSGYTLILGYKSDGTLIEQGIWGYSGNQIFNPPEPAGKSNIVLSSTGNLYIAGSTNSPGPFLLKSYAGEDTLVSGGGSVSSSSLTPKKGDCCTTSSTTSISPVATQKPGSSYVGYYDSFIFSLNPPVPVSFVANLAAAGTITPPNQFFFVGTLVSVTATPAPTGYQFYAWSSNIATFDNPQNPLATATINGQGTIYANFTVGLTFDCGTSVTCASQWAVQVNGNSHSTSGGQTSQTVYVLPGQSMWFIPPGSGQSCNNKCYWVAVPASGNPSEFPTAISVQSPTTITFTWDLESILSISLLPSPGSTPASGSNYFTATLKVANNAYSWADTGGQLTFYADTNTQVNISPATSSTSAQEEWCLSDCSTTTAFSFNSPGMSQTYYYYDLLSQTVTYTITGGGNPSAPTLSYVTSPASAGSTNSPRSASATLPSTVYALRGSQASAPSTLTISSQPLERWLASSSSWTVSASATTQLSYANQYYITFQVASGESTWGSVVQQTGWYNAGSPATIQASASSGYVFSTWAVSGQGPITVSSLSSATTTATFNGPGTITAYFDIPVDLTLSGPSSASSGSPVTLTAYLTDLSGNGIGGKTIGFYQGSSLLGSGVTSLTGIVGRATLTFTPSSCGSFVYSAQFGGDVNHAPATSGTITITISGCFDFSISASGASVPQASSGASTVTLTLLSGSTTSVSYSFSGQPAGVTLSAPSCSPTCSSTISITVGACVATGSYSVTVTGAGGGKTHPTSFTLTVTATTFTVTIAASPSFGGTTSPSGTHSYGSCSAVSISAYPKTSYTFSGWESSGSIVIANPSAASTTATIDGSGTIYADFGTGGGSHAAGPGLITSGNNKQAIPNGLARQSMEVPTSPVGGQSLAKRGPVGI